MGMRQTYATGFFLWNFGGLWTGMFSARFICMRLSFLLFMHGLMVEVEG